MESKSSPRLQGDIHRQPTPVFPSHFRVNGHTCRGLYRILQSLLHLLRKLWLRNSSLLFLVVLIISQLPVRFAGVGVSNPVSAADANFALSLSMTADVSASLKSGSELDAIGYGLDSTRVLRQAKKAQEAELADKLERLKASARPPDARRMVRSTTTGAWLTATPSSDFGTALSSTEFRDSLRIRHGLTPLGLASHCDACPHAWFTVGHASRA